MKINEIIAWLNRFDKNDDFSIVVVDTKKRIVHQNKRANFITDMPAIILEIDGIEPFDDVVEKEE